MRQPPEINRKQRDGTVAPNDEWNRRRRDANLITGGGGIGGRKGRSERGEGTVHLGKTDLAVKCKKRTDSEPTWRRDQGKRHRGEPQSGGTLGA